MYIDFQNRIQDLVGSAVTDTNALTEWLTEEAMNAINIMSPDMLISASSTHRILDSEQFNYVGRTISTEYASGITELVLSAGALTSTANCREGSVISVGSSTATVGEERMIVTNIAGSGGSARTLTVVRGVHGTEAATIASGLQVYVTHEKGFNTRKHKLLEVNRNGYRATPTSSGMSEQLLDKNSIHNPTSRSPSFYLKSGNIYIRPRCTLSEQGEIIGVNYPVIKYDMKSATDLPVEAEDFITIGTARKYIVRSMYEEFANLPNAITVPTVPTAPTLTSNEIGFFGTAPIYTPLTISPSFGAVDTFISVDEDVELAGIKIQEINVQINKYQADIQNQLNIFNEENVEYQSEVQKAIENARLSSQDDAQALQKYQAELQNYTSEIAGRMQIYSSSLQKVTTKYNWFMAQYDKLTLMYNEKAQILRGVQA